MGQKAISNPSSGQQWERTAESFLRNRGLKLLQRNFSSRFGEIDLIMEDGKTVVFVEVRYRKHIQHGSGAESITYHKQNRISLTALWYLARNPYQATRCCRFDVISIGANKTCGIEWIKDAFYSTIS